MKILLIEDNISKATHIINALNNLNETNIMHEKARNSGLKTFIEVMKSTEPFDFIITDNYMPIYDNERDCKPFAKNIISEIKRRGYTNLPICVCSSETIEDTNADYTILYNHMIDLEDIFNNIILEINM